MSSTIAGTGGELTITLKAQDVLVVSSAVISFIKTLVSVGTYSVYQVALSVFELILTTLALFLFITGDYIDDTTAYEDDKNVFLGAFILSVVIEIFDVFITSSTVKAFKKLKIEMKYDRNQIDEVKKKARKQYLKLLFLLTFLVSIAPAVAFARSGWSISNFTPSAFSGNIGHFLYISTMISLVQVGVMIRWSCCCFRGYEDMDALMGFRLILFILGSLPAWGLIYAAVGKVETEEESGSVAYLTLLTAFQSVELGCEVQRCENVVDKLNEFTRKAREQENIQSTSEGGRDKDNEVDIEDPDGHSIDSFDSS